MLVHFLESTSTFVRGIKEKREKEEREREKESKKKTRCGKTRAEIIYYSVRNPRNARGRLEKVIVIDARSTVYSQPGLRSALYSLVPFLSPPLSSALEGCLTRKSALDRSRLSDRGTIKRYAVSGARIPGSLQLTGNPAAVLFPRANQGSVCLGRVDRRSISGISCGSREKCGDTLPATVESGVSSRIRSHREGTRRPDNFFFTGQLIPSAPMLENRGFDNLSVC